MDPLEILYRDEHIVIINKPAGLLVHRTRIAQETEHFVVQQLRDQLGCRVYPAHRLDRKTSGVLALALDKETDPLLQEEIRKPETQKYYVCLVRGYLPQKGRIDKELLKENGSIQDAHTLYACLQQTEIPVYVSRYPQSRYSLALVKPLTGRLHQIRRHMAHARHYIIGDLKHGECKHNKMFREHYGLQNMLLHAWYLRIKHPHSGAEIQVQVPFPVYWEQLLPQIGMQLPLWKPGMEALFADL